MGIRDANTGWWGREPPGRRKEDPASRLCTHGPGLSCASLWGSAHCSASERGLHCPLGETWACGKTAPFRDPQMVSVTFCFFKSEVKEWTKLQKVSHVSRYRALNCLNSVNVKSDCGCLASGSFFWLMKQLVTDFWWAQPSGVYHSGGLTMGPQILCHRDSCTEFNENSTVLFLLSEDAHCPTMGDENLTESLVQI